MSPSGRSVPRRAGQVVAGLGALVALLGLLVGGPVALITFAGNPLPDHVPGLAEIGTALTSRDDGQLFVRALAVVGWFGWATFALAVLVEVPARMLRRPAPRLPGMRRQQRVAATLIGSVALILAASPAVAATASVAAPPTSYGVVAHEATAADMTTRDMVARGYAAPYADRGAPAATPPAWRSDGRTGPYGTPRPAARHTPAGPAPAWLASSGQTGPAAPVYRVAVGDYLGQIADRYLGDFARYRELARLNRIADPSLIRPGQLLRLPPGAIDHGRRPHATGRLIRPPAAPHRSAPVPPPAIEPPVTQPPSAQPSAAQPPVQPGPAPERTGGAPLSVGASRAAEVGAVNRPLAVSAVLTVAGMVGAQIGALLGLRRRPTTDRGSAAETGRHRRPPP
ncbi:LysM peptidoglycan-binding domain-containing protein [Plantactinospora sp. GCM10030261]|uniref:LysM peptidoglycan-binding domain-containing protein n=1 Tax=Plantactinospora sp. GCM10030261 TaxID=3273420 RepID=UPI0036195AED